MHYPRFVRVVDEVQQKLIESGQAKPIWRNGAKITPMIDTLPHGLFYTYTEHLRVAVVLNGQKVTHVEHWAYVESIDKVPTVIVHSAGWREWMFNFRPRICDCVAYHVNLVRKACDDRQIVAMLEAIEPTVAKEVA